jgi:hypothetical protein
MKPILFNTEMVKAILDGRKSETRRVIKPQPLMRKGETIFHCWLDDERGHLARFEDDLSTALCERKSHFEEGDVLYVRETWQKFGRCFIFKADEEKLTWWKNLNIWKWHPSIHMPKEAARIFLRVTCVKAQRLQDITEDGAKAEGCLNVIGGIQDCRGSAKHQFTRLWNSTVKKSDRDKYGWGANPWVWVISFERCGKPKI